jgi:hypothetical protein
MKNGDHLTQGHGPVLARQISLTYPGMAHFAATGPLGTTCAECASYGYWRKRQNAAGDVVGTKFRKGACGKHFELTRQHGLPVPADTESCRHFTRRDP